MTRPRVLCVSGDRSTRAAMALSLADAPVTAVVADAPSTAIDRLEHEAFDAVVVDASRATDVPELVDAVENRRPETPTFVRWTDDDDDSAIAALTEAIARAGSASTSDDSTEGGAGVETGLAGTVAERLDRRGDLEAVVGAVRRRLADARSPREIERAIREGFTDDDRFAFAWCGEYDRGERQIVPWLVDAATVQWPLRRTFAIGDGSQPALERAMRSREVQVVREVSGTVDAVPLGPEAVERDATSVAVAPLCTDDDLYGVLVVYAHDHLSERERDAVERVAETASYALESVAIRGRIDQQAQALRRYERLVEAAGDGMYVLDEEGHFTTVNDAFVGMTGYSREGLLGEHVSLLFGDAGMEVGQETIERLLATDATTDTIEAELNPKDGDPIPCEIQLAVLEGDDGGGDGDGHGCDGESDDDRGDGSFAGAVGVVRDVADRKRRIEKLRRQNERLDGFASIVSHDLRNPLGVAQGYLDLLEETGSLDHADDVREGLDRMETIIADVLAIAREGQMVVEAEPVDLETVAREAWETVSTEEAALSVAGTLSFDADRARLLRLFENLFRNAVEHGGADVSVRVGPLEDDGRPGFFVADDGPGLSDEIRGRAFENEVTTAADGLGIGLWVVRDVADGHGWTTTATEGDEGGARFEFSEIGG